MAINNYAVLQLGVVVNMVVADEELAAQNGWVLIPEGLPVHKNWTYESGEFVPSAENIARIKENFLLEGARLLAESAVSVQPDLWEGYTTEQKQAWIDYRAALRNVPNVVNAENFDHENYELPVITQV